MSHPVLVQLLRAPVRQRLRATGVGFLDSFSAARELVDDAAVDAAISVAPQAVRAKLSEVIAATAAAVAATGTATAPVGDAASILQWFLMFLSSDLGKALIAILLSLLGI